MLFHVYLGFVHLLQLKKKHFKEIVFSAARLLHHGEYISLGSGIHTKWSCDKLQSGVRA